MPNATARDLMHEGCKCVNVMDTVIDAAMMMAEEGIGSLPICGNDNKLHGMLTDRDIVVKCLALGKDPNETACGELAEGKVVWIEDTAPVRDVLSRMEEHQIRRLPVIDGNKKLVGIISQGDIARHLGELEVGELVGAVSQGPPRQEPA